MEPDSMENGKLERMQRALDQWVQQHPQEVRRLRERARPLAEFLNSSEWDAFWQPAKAAISRGDETAIRAWVEDRIGIKPDPVLRVHLSAKELGEATPRQTWELVDGRGSRLRRSAKAQSVERRRPKIRRRIKRFPSLDRALKALALGDQTREQVLEEHILSLAYKAQEEAGGPLSDAELVRIITGQLRRDALGSQTTRREELLLLAEFVEREAFLKQALELGRQAGLTPREFEVYKLLIENPKIKYREVAQNLGMSTSQVGVLKHRIKHALGTARFSTQP
jgi:DNA-binding CsgD family transcriptional regulator